MQLSPIQASWGGRVDCDSRVNRLGAFKKTLPERVLRQGLGLTPLDETINNLGFCFLRHENSLACILARVVFGSVTAIQTCIQDMSALLAGVQHTLLRREQGGKWKTIASCTFLHKQGLLSSPSSCSASRATFLFPEFTTVPSQELSKTILTKWKSSHT